jgi:phage-related protein
MAAFPTLRTQAVAQYPSSRALRYQNQKLRFVDGYEQRYRDAAGPLHQWTIRLNQLDETEMAAIEQFFLENQGRFTTFSFTDPWDGAVYPICTVSADTLNLSFVAEMRGQATLTIVENRS